MKKGSSADDPLDIIGLKLLDGSQAASEKGINGNDLQCKYGDLQDDPYQKSGFHDLIFHQYVYRSLCCISITG